MSTPNDRLYNLLPQIIRLRDSQDPAEPLRSLLSVISEQADLLEANVAQLYDDWFIETCQDWIVPYIGDLIGYDVLHEAGDPSTGTTPADIGLDRILIPRADVGNTVGARRRKGTLHVLVDLARDVAGWSAVAVEFSRRTAITQGLNDLHLTRGRTVDVRASSALERIGSVGDDSSRLADVRGPRTGSTSALPTSGVGLLVPRYRGYSVSESTAAWIPGAGDHCFTFSALGNDVPLYSGAGLPIALHPADVASETYYGDGKSLAIWTRAEGDAQNILVARERIVPADLSRWRRKPSPGTVAVDAKLGRISFPPDEVPAQVIVSYHYGFSYELGAGEYERLPLPLPAVPLTAAVLGENITFAGACLRGIEVLVTVDGVANASYLTTAKDTLASVAAGVAKAIGAATIPGISATATDAVVTVDGIQSLAVSFPVRSYAIAHDGSESHERLSRALERWKADGPARAVIEFGDSEIYDEDEIAIELFAGQVLQIRAASGARPVIRMTEWRAGGTEPVKLSGAPGSAVTLDGLVVAGSGLRIAGGLGRLGLRSSTLVPGWKHLSPSARRNRVEPSIIVEDTATAIAIENSILGPIVVRRDERAAVSTPIAIADSIVDAFEHGEAIASPDARVANAELRVARSTIFGRVRVHAVTLAENSIFDREVSVTDRQHGCFRYSFVPHGSRTPPRYACQPAHHDVKVSFASTRFDDPGYARLTDDVSHAIAAGADDRSEMGAFHDLYRPERETNLRIRLAEYTPAGTDLALLFVS